MNKKLLLLFALVYGGLHAQLSRYGYFREITNVKEQGYYAVPLSPDVLAKCRSGFTDFRIYEVAGTDTLEAPFLMNWKDDEFKNIEYEATLVDESYKKGCCSFVTLKFGEPKEINEIHLDVQQNNFDKLIKIEGSADNRDWKTIDENMRIVGFGFDDYKYTKLNFGTCTFRYFRITTDDKDSKPVKIIGASTYYNRYLTGSFVRIDNVKVLRSEKKAKAESYRTAKGKTIEKKELNQTELKIILPAKYCLHHLKLKSRDSMDFYRYITISDAEKNSVCSTVFTSLEKNKCTIVPTEKVVTGELILTVDNKDNQPVKNIEIEVYGQLAELYCKFDPEKNYFLSYSVPDDHKPEYDMEYFADRLPQSKGSVILGPEKVTKEIKATEPLVKDQKWLWITLVVMVVLIGGFAFSLMKKANNA
ncbi:MAG: discoidin domain-containing protein [Bacteroidia bacterium]